MQTTDQTGRSFQRTFTVTVTAANQAPTSIALNNSTVNENVVSGTTVGSLSTVDPNPSDTHTYTLVSGTGSTDNASFAISGNSLVTATALNFETKSSYSVRVRSTDSSGLFTEQSFTITVTNVNEAPTLIALTSSTVAESSPIGSSVGTFSTTDPDVGDSHTYTLVIGTGSTDNASFQIVGNALQTATILDIETQSSYSIRVRSTDTAGLFTEQTFTITVTNVNEAPTSIALNNSTISDASPIGTVVGTLSSVDPDAGDTHTYTLEVGTGSTDNVSFTIVGNELRTASAIDLLSQASYSVRVRSTDAGGLSTESAFSITVTEVNVGPTAIVLDPLTVTENAASGTTVGTLATTDSNVSDTHTYTLVSGTGDDDNASFTISGDAIVTAQSFDFETQSSYTIRVRSTDAGGLFTEEAFVISVTNVNEAPLAIAIDTSAIEEGQAIGTVVGTLSTTDSDAGDSHTYTIVSGDGDDDNASFTITGSNLVAAEVFDFSTQSSYTVRVRSTDDGGLFTETALVITVTEINVGPTAIVADNLDIQEGQAIGTLVGTLTTTDANIVDSHIYTLVAGIGDDDNASFTLNDDEILSAEIFDFSVKSSYTILVRSTDAGGLSVDQILIITINEVNVAPSAISLDTSVIAENSVSGTAVGTLSTTDGNATDSHTFTLATGTGDDDNGSFAIVGNALVTTESFDFETKSSYTVRVRSTDAGGLFTEEVFAISVSNVNEATTLIELSSSSIEEGLPIGTIVGALTSTDPDTGDSHTYMLAVGTGDDDNGSFTISGGDLVSDEVFNFATKSSYSIRVRSTDIGGLFTEETFVITVTQANVAPTAIALDNLAILEQAVVGTTVGTLTTTDANVIDSFTYTLAVGTGDDDNASFTIAGDQVVSAEVFDFPTKSSYSIRVRTTDAGGLFTEETFIITITSTNQAPTAIALDNALILENEPIGTTVGVLSTTDSDVGDFHVYSLATGPGDDDNASFAVFGNELITNDIFDFSTKSSYTVRVRSADDEGLFFEQVFVITVTEINVGPTAVLLDAMTILENEVVGTVVGNLSSTDANVVESHTYTIVSGDGDDDNPSFAISGTQLVTTEAFDFETKSSYSVRIRTTDIGGLFTEDFFVITVLNVNETPTAIILDNSTAVDLAPIGTAIGQFSTTDVDAGDTHSYSLVSGDGDDHNTSFEIVSGELRTLVALDFTATPTYSIRVRTTDFAGLTFEQIFTITETP
ncbi:MAG TPA: hypothetical protein DDZ51_10120 [Planctomycetaceae bacterium]|nr:hypothetical protein [Planctomycetaceae bacterium]